ncbi:hypothetical protein JCM10908_005860 [Rhodotorula pacifica]|uniref:uncharacterized protein n=1 Tax=Rhodotorula pacifica TaxID=1495444 RepID=UPI00317F0553
MNLGAPPHQSSSTTLPDPSSSVVYPAVDSTYSLEVPYPLTAPHSVDHSPEHFSAQLPLAPPQHFGLHQQPQTQQQQQQQQLPSPSPISPTFPPNSRQPFKTGPTETLDLSVGPSQAGASAPTQNRIGGGAAQGSRPAPSIVAFDPDNAGSADDDDEEDDEDSGSSKKKRKTRTGAARMKKSSAGAGKVNAAGDAGEAAAGGSGSGKEDLEPRRKIEIGYIEKKEKRHITFSKRKAGIMKKAYELATLTGTEVLLLVVSETGIVYTFTTTKFQPLVGANPDGSPSEGQRLIQQCLAVDPEDAESSNYISPPPDGPLLPLPPSARKRPFEANSSAHGGQIALRTRQQRPKNKPRPPPIGVPAPDARSEGQSLPTPGIHATLDQMADAGGPPPGPGPISHSGHPLRGLPIPPPPPPSHGGMSGSGTSYPPSPSYPPGHPHGHHSELPSPIHATREYAEMMDRNHLNSHYGHGPPQRMDYPPPPALGYASHQLPPPPLHHRNSLHSLDSYSTQLQPAHPQSRMHGYPSQHQQQQQQHQQHQQSQQHHPYSHQYATHHPSGYAAHPPSPSSAGMRGGGYFEGGGGGPLRRSATNGQQQQQQSIYGAGPPLPSPNMHPRGSVDEDMHMLSPLQQQGGPPPSSAGGNGVPGGAGLGRGSGLSHPQHLHSEQQQQQHHRERIERRHSLATSTAGMMYDTVTGSDGRMGAGPGAIGGGGQGGGLPPPPSQQQGGGGEDAYMRR